ncbi:hypothetical protein LTR84_013124 [Exophiala bonariae]|uniref:C2H2-type domain-containing protein n=1 Tax=Exophiala bonariae TaxID=1690606 RepID=A0AAV9NEW1_9EURO|nr:hypothetical protein LTR84_013124 [Exophiala bonariae]
MSALNSDKVPTSEDPKTESNLAVEDAIREATNDRVRIVLLSIVKESSVARDLVSKELLVQQKEDSASRNPKKRKRYEICKQCSKEYAVEQNHEKICVHHPGAKQLDFNSGFWKFVKNDDQIKDDEESQEGYEWTCCHERGNAVGCTTSEHSPQEIKHTKLKFYDE